MTKELIINTSEQGTEIALLEDKILVELHSQLADASFAAGDIYLGRVKKLIPGLNAAFVDVGFEKDAFLHYTDLSPYVRSLLKFTHLAMNEHDENGFDFSKFKVEPEIIKTGKITEVLNGKPNVLVQILKEPIAQKGPRLTCEISLPGTRPNIMVQRSAVPHSTSAALKRSPRRYGALSSWSVSVFSIVS